MARFKRARRAVRRVKSYGRRHKSTSGIVGDMMAGGIVGAIAQVAAPIINQNVPSIGPLRPTTATILGGGIAAKAVLHKGGKFASAAIVIGTAMAVGDLMANFPALGGGGAGGYPVVD